jgi:hypothetical protein
MSVGAKAPIDRESDQSVSGVSLEVDLQRQGDGTRAEDDDISHAGRLLHYTRYEDSPTGDGGSAYRATGPDRSGGVFS